MNKKVIKEKNVIQENRKINLRLQRVNSQRIKERGITLVSLVVTIIILMILAGTTINLVLGDNGIITMAKKAREKTEEARDEEIINMQMMLMQIKGENTNIGTTLYDKRFENSDKWHLVIEDENQNQFVWVPCTNLENDENIPIIRKENFMKDNTSQSYFECYEETGFENFIESLLENGGFYIARFEMSNENGNPVSKAGKEVWVDINYTDANKLARNMYDNINSRLLNGFAYDIAIRFMLDEIDMGNIPRGTGITGNSVYKNIYDLTDDYGEWTEEQKYGSRIFRRTVFYEDEMLFCDRFTDDEDATHSILGFRTIIYK